MFPRNLTASTMTIVFILALGGVSLGGDSDNAAPPTNEAPKTDEPLKLPGMQPNGQTLIFSQWSLRPAGAQVLLGDFPVSIAVHPSAPYAAVLHAGYGEHEIVVVDLTTRKTVCRRSRFPAPMPAGHG